MVRSKRFCIFGDKCGVILKVMNAFDSALGQDSKTNKRAVTGSPIRQKLSSHAVPELITV